MANRAERRVAERIADDIKLTYDIGDPEEVLEHVVKAFFGDNHKKRRK